MMKERLRVDGGLRDGRLLNKTVFSCSQRASKIRRKKDDRGCEQLCELR